MTEITLFHNNRVNECKSSIQLCENELNKQIEKIANIKQQLIKIIAKETIANHCKIKNINELIPSYFTLTDAYLEKNYNIIYNEIEILFDLELKRKLLDNEYKNECKYCKILELSIEDKKQDFINLTKKTMEEITVDYRQTENWSLFD